MQEKVTRIVELGFPQNLYPDFDVEREQITRSSLWPVAFTHKSAYPNTNTNYEKLEFLGDKIMNLCFTRYLIEKFPDITENQLNNFITNYLSTSMQAEISRSLKLSDNLISTYKNYLKNLDNIQEDLLESVYGALFEAANNVSISYGFQGVYNLTIYIFEVLFPIDINYALDDPRSKLNNIIMHIDGYITGDHNRMYTKIKIKDGWKVSINLPPNIMIFIQDAIKNEKGANKEREFWNRYKEELVSVVDDDVNIATRIAASNALDILHEYGFNDDLLIRNLNFVKDIPVSLEKKVRDRMAELGHVDLIFPHLGVPILQLIGITEVYEDGHKFDSKVIISSTPIKKNDNINRLKLNLLNKYIA